ncbi:STAS/SEC14 domain-containing protein [Alcanivorax sp. S6407]|uniref:STAS/SEC14 domain-containing protein n=1 Tax=Alcanivorax sp. S6407 TaxID=2926424 RepID=UPI001FF21687|nr:STAS/SEC14 domain-containing protein [Alcanivorax sp. S6407]MCK0154579.1 STAS/SEC14 domain-containing protein [Alcanivorax sp. S6407]
MLTLIPFADSRVVGVRISGKITRPEFDSMVEKLEAVLQEHGKVRVYVELERFGGVAMDTLLEDLKFGIRHWNDVERKVVVSDADWVHRLARLSSRLFSHIQVKVFERDQEQEAKSWICEE